ncbi:MAG: glycosyltransferase [Moheibacter sp.]
MSKKKILLLSTSSSRNAGGLYNSVRNLGQQFAKDKVIDPVIMAFHDEHSDVDNLAYDPLKLIEYHIQGPSGVAFTTDLKEKMEEFKPDLVHVQGIWLYTSHVNTKYCKKQNVPYMISPRGMLDPWILSQRSWKKKLGLFLYEQKHIDNSACINALAMSEYNAIRDFGYKKPIAVIPNGVYLPSESPMPEAKTPWQEDGRKSLLFLSRLHVKKGIENLLEAWSKLNSEEKQDWKLIVAGEPHDAAYRQKLNEMLIQFQLEKNVFFIGNQAGADKDITFRSVDAFTLPSYSEGMPMSVLEAWSYKLPVLMTEFCNIPEGFEEKAALKINPNVESTLNGLKELFSLSDEERKTMGQYGLDLVKKKFTWETIASQMTEVYDWILSDKQSETPSTVILN